MAVLEARGEDRHHHLKPSVELAVVAAAVVVAAAAEVPVVCYPDCSEYSAAAAAVAEVESVEH